jgi:hypothetical protein
MYQCANNVFFFFVDCAAEPSVNLLWLVIEFDRGLDLVFYLWVHPIPRPASDPGLLGLTTIHIQMDLADAFVAIIWEKRNPLLIITASEKMSFSRDYSHVQGYRDACQVQDTNKAEG